MALKRKPLKIVWVTYELMSKTTLTFNKIRLIFQDIP